MMYRWREFLYSLMNLVPAFVIAIFKTKRLYRCFRCVFVGAE